MGNDISKLTIDSTNIIQMFKNKKYQTVCKMCEKYFTEDNHDPDIYYVYAVSKVLLKDFKTASEYIILAFNGESKMLFDEKSSGLMYFGKMFYGLKTSENYEKSFKFFKKAEELNFTNYELYNYLGYHYEFGNYVEQNYDLAFKNYKLSYNMEKKFSSIDRICKIYLNLLEQNKITNFEECLDWMLKRHLHISSFMHIGKVYEAMNKYDTAISYYEQHIKFVDNNRWTFSRETSKIIIDEKEISIVSIQKLIFKKEIAEKKSDNVSAT